MPKKTMQKSIRQGISWAVIESMLSALFSFLTTLICARYVSASDFGLVAIAIAVIAIAQAILLTGPLNAIIRTPAMDTALSDSIFWSMIVLGVLATVLCIAMSGPLAAVFEAPDLQWLVIGGAVLCLLEAVSGVPSALLSRKMRTRALALRTLGQKITTLVVTAALAIADYGAWAILIGAMAGTFCGTVFLLSQAPRRPALRIDLPRCLPIFRLGMAINLELFAGMLSPRLILLLYGRFHGIESLGYLNFAVRLIDEISNLLRTVVARTALPLFATLRRTGGDDIAAFKIGTTVICCLSGSVLLGLAAVAPYLIPPVFGEHWVPSIYAVQVLAFSSALLFSRSLVPPLLLSRGKQLPQIANSWLALAVGIIASLILADVQYPGSTWIYVIPSLAIIPSGLLMARYFGRISLKDQLLPSAGPILSAALMFVVVQVVAAMLPDTLPTAITIVSLIVVGALWQLIYVSLFARSTAQWLLKAAR